MVGVSAGRPTGRAGRSGRVGHRGRMPGRGRRGGVRRAPRPDRDNGQRL